MNRTKSSSILFSIGLVSAFFASGLITTAAAETGIAQPGIPGAAGTQSGSELKKETKKESAEAGKKKDEGAVLKPGVIATVGGGGTGPQAVSADTGGAAPGDQAAAVSASIRPGRTPGKCEAVVINSSETDTYKVSFAVVPFDRKSGRKGSPQSFSASLPPKKTVTKDVNCTKGQGMQVVLKRGVRTASTKKKDKEGEAAESGSEAAPAGEKKPTKS